MSPSRSARAPSGSTMLGARRVGQCRPQDVAGHRRNAERGAGPQGGEHRHCRLGVSGADAAALALARGRGRHRAPRAESDGAAGLCDRPPESAADHLDPQRGDPSEAAIPALLSAAARIRVAPCRAHRRRLTADAESAGARAVSAQVHGDPLRSRAHALPAVWCNRDASADDPGQRHLTNRVVCRTPRSLQRCGRAAQGGKGS